MVNYNGQFYSAWVTNKEKEENNYVVYYPEDHKESTAVPISDIQVIASKPATKVIGNILNRLVSKEQLQPLTDQQLRHFCLSERVKCEAADSKGMIIDKLVSAQEKKAIKQELKEDPIFHAFVQQYMQTKASGAQLCETNKMLRKEHFILKDQLVMVRKEKQNIEKDLKKKEGQCQQLGGLVRSVEKKYKLLYTNPQ